MNPETFTFIKGAPFFERYLPEIRNVKHKMRGKNGRGNPVDFSPAEKEKIRGAIKKLSEDLLAQKK